MKKVQFFLLMIILIIIDQLSKFFILNNKNELPKTIINNILDFNYCENRGIAFGIGEGNVQLFSIITFIIIIVIMVFILKYYYKINKISLMGITIMIAGGIGNLIDRIFRLYVVDFIDFSKLVKFPIFNFADICVVIGVIIIVISYLYINRGEQN